MGQLLQDLNTNFYFGFFGSLASFIGLVIAYVQWRNYRSAEQQLLTIRRHRNADIWTNISLLLQAYESIEDARNLWSTSEISNTQLLAKINSARRSIVSQYLHLLKEAALDEPRFSDQTIQEWIKCGRLENEWRIAQARRLIPTQGFTATPSSPPKK